MEWIDLTHEISESVPRAKASTPPRIATVRRVGIDGINLMEYTLSTHAGSHVDAPLHFVPGGETIDLGFPRRTGQPSRSFLTV